MVAAVDWEATRAAAAGASGHLSAPPAGTRVPVRAAAAPGLAVRVTVRPEMAQMAALLVMARRGWAHSVDLQDWERVVARVARVAGVAGA